jgi:hypothetical protein
LSATDPRTARTGLPLKGLTEIRTWAIYVCLLAKAMRVELPAHVDLLVVEPRFEIIIDSFIRDRAEQSHVPHSRLLLLS